MIAVSVENIIHDTVYVKKMVNGMPFEFPLYVIR